MHLIYSSKCLLVKKNSGSLFWNHLNEKSRVCAVENLVWSTSLEFSNVLVCFGGGTLAGDKPCISMVTKCLLDGHVIAVACNVYTQQF